MDYRMRHFIEGAGAGVPVSERFVSERDKIFEFRNASLAEQVRTWTEQHWNPSLGCRPTIV
jgi:hypothetical protein